MIIKQIVPLPRNCYSSSCETQFRVNDDIVTLWIIVGGTPALDFREHGGFCERFPTLAKYKTWDSETRKYPHQKSGEGPTLDDLPHGNLSLTIWYQKNKPLLDLRDLRYKQVYALIRPFAVAGVPNLGMCPTLQSPRFHDTEQRCHFRAEFMLYNWNYVPHVGISSKYYAGASDGMFGSELQQYGNQAWIEFAALMEQTIPPVSHKVTGWQDLTEEEFQAVLAGIKTVLPKK